MKGIKHNKWSLLTQFIYAIISSQIEHIIVG